MEHVKAERKRHKQAQDKQNELPMLLSTTQQIVGRKKAIHHDYKEDDDDVDDWSNKTIYKIIIPGTMYISGKWKEQ